MTDTPTATQATAPTTAGSAPPTGEQPTQKLGGSPVSAAAASSKANQQAAAAGEAQGLSNTDNATPPTPDTPETQTSTDTQTTPEPASLTPKPRFENTGNQQIDQVASMLANSGLESADSLLNEVLTDKQLSLVSKAELVTEYGADVAKLIISQLENSVADMAKASEAEGQRLKDYTYKKIGGDNPDTTWAGLQEFAQSPAANLSADDKKVLNRMLSNGGLEAEMVIDSLLSKYQQNGGYTNPPNLMQGDTNYNSGFQPMSKAEYQREIGPAVVKYGESSQEVQALRNRRAISMSRGHN
jgi:hypothetical protein